MAKEMLLVKEDDEIYFEYADEQYEDSPITISGLIKMLEKAKEEFGDLEVGKMDGNGILWSIEHCRKCSSAEEQCFEETQWSEKIIVL